MKINPTINQINPKPNPVIEAEIARKAIEQGIKAMSKQFDVTLVLLT